MLYKLKNKIKNSSKIGFRLHLCKKIGLRNYFVNFLFQRILFRHSRLKFSVNFTSTISEKGITYHEDITTLASFALSGHCYFQAVNGINLGKNFLFAPGVKLISANHSKASERKPVLNSPIVIGDNVWLGANVIVLPGVQIGDNCIVGAGSVVTKSFPESNLIIAGNPAKIIRKGS